MNGDELCCGGTTRLTVSDYSALGLKRQRSRGAGVRGKQLETGDGLSARFRVAVEGGRIAAVSFRCTTCVTLVAYCELLCQRAEHRSLRTALRLSPGDLATTLTDVPPAKRDRALLATSAFQSAIARVVADGARITT